MKITVFTSNQPRHINLVNLISDFAEETYAVLECNTLFPGLIHDFYKNSPTMQEYMVSVRNAEAHLFGKARFISSKVKSLAMKSADLNYLTQVQLEDALQSDVYVVFGSSYIKGWLIDFLIEKGALNIHMGLSPYYRGASCNFWAMYDMLPNFVGATIHYLSRGLDSGPMIFHSVPKFEGEDPFAFSMKAVLQAQNDLVYFIKNLKQFDASPIHQNRELQLRYTKNSDFTDKVAREFLDRNFSSQDLEALIINSKKPDLIDLS